MHLRQNPGSPVAIKSITKKNLSKSHNLLGKEIKILKVSSITLLLVPILLYIEAELMMVLSLVLQELSEVHHENIVALLDCQVRITPG